MRGRCPAGQRGVSGLRRLPINQSHRSLDLLRHLGRNPLRPDVLVVLEEIFRAVLVGALVFIHPGEDFGDRDSAWARKFFSALGRFREGVYVNFLGGDEDPGRVREAYGDAVYDRLVDVKTTYDPDNVFHHNQNIRPR